MTSTMANFPPKVNTRLNYHKHDSGSTIYYAGTGSDRRRAWDVHPVTVHDMRLSDEEFTLDKNGFQLVQNATEECAFESEVDFEHSLYAETASLLRRVTGATRVVPISHVRRRDTWEHVMNKTKECGDDEVVDARGPAMFVHIDQSYAGAVQLLHDNIDNAESLMKTRWAVINVWQPEGRPVTREPLAVCDSRSVAEEDLRPMTAVLPKTKSLLNAVSKGVGFEFGRSLQILSIGARRTGEQDDARTQLSRASSTAVQEGEALSNCEKQNEAASCEYSQLSRREPPGVQNNAARAEARLEHLEELVHQLVAHNNNDAESTPTTSERSEKQTHSENATLYTGPTHHAAMLEDIAELRSVLGESTPVLDVDDSVTSGSEMDVLFGRVRPMTFDQILSKWLRTKTECDRRVAAYFRAQGIAAPFIHVQQFHDQYEKFWQNRDSTSPLWISILFSICYLSERIGPDVAATPPGFSYAATQCLALGQYSRLQRFAVEAITIFIQAQITDNLDACRDSGMLFGVLVPLAYTLGYHRDPHDTDLTENMSTLPPPRPPSEMTKMLFYNSKQILASVFANILQAVLCTSPDAQDSLLLQRQQELDDAYATIPTALHYHNISESIADPVILFVTRRCLQLMYDKCRLVLHRRHIAHEREASIRICFDAAKSIVNGLLNMYPEFKPGGQLFGDRWLMSSIAFNDFLTGVMALSLILCQDQRTNIGCLSWDERCEINQMLKSSREICEENRDRSAGARRMLKLLGSLRPLVSMEETQQAPIAPLADTSMSDSEERAIAQSDFAELFTETNMFDDPQWALMEDFLNTSFEM
ncbi:hypothetical protein CBER1_02071 [Cercospora berteroae]|uniref:Transcription factor domain-containing protein n=1 Tax=Cercospora berteroae TaxID=357750 RepID=A0A2S6C8Q0_9PEZI|nr:hypothetical protein CBER1_02071 [Cercospora berteroae]